MDGPGSVIGEIDTLIKPGEARWEIDGENRGHPSVFRLICAKRDGRPISEVLVDLTRLMDQADVVAGYSVDFDLKMYRGACRRAGMDDRYKRRKGQALRCDAGMQAAVQAPSDPAHAAEERLQAAKASGGGRYPTEAQPRRRASRNDRLPGDGGAVLVLAGAQLLMISVQERDEHRKD